MTPLSITCQTGKISRTIKMNANNVVNIIGDTVSYYDTTAAIISPDGKVIAHVHVGFREQVVTD